MIKRTLYFGNAAYLKCSKSQLVVNYPDDRDERTMPVEDIGIVILDHYQITISQPLITQLLYNNVALITCNERHLPHGLMLNLDGHYTQQAHLDAQINATKAVKDRLWKEVIQRKIRNQACLMEELGIKSQNMSYWESQVKAGDPANMEGRAAAYYWKNLFKDYVENFTRGRFEEAPNHLLNYGYAILRAVVARSLVGSGLHPSIGVHHHNQYNAYCLADDLMEAYRPFVDKLVVEIIKTEEVEEELDWNLKSILLQIPTLDVIMNKKRSPLMVAVQQTTSSLASCFLKEKKNIKLPEWVY